MGDSSFEEESADEYDGYDPVHSRLVDDKVTYRPRYAPSEHNEDSSSDDLNDEPEDRASYSHYFPHSPVGSPDERPVVKSEQNESQKSTDNDREYHVEPVVDVTTPCYAPSQALSRTPESSPALSYTASEHASDVVPTKKVESNIPERIAELEESEDNNSSSSESDIDEYSQMCSSMSLIKVEMISSKMYHKQNLVLPPNLNITKSFTVFLKIMMKNKTRVNSMKTLKDLKEMNNQNLK
uniref:Uncharacterized protein n=1 Tax=Trichobilharzia regenti TaxID=157069 RepID=A0AA85JRV1_TRIRE|nr:unnamed protein product [Trichobilharzia regenti]